MVHTTQPLQTATVQYPRLEQIRGGWAAHGNGWAVHGSTPEEATARYREMEALLAEMAQRPYWRERTRRSETMRRYVFWAICHECRRHSPTAEAGRHAWAVKKLRALGWLFIYPDKWLCPEHAAVAIAASAPDAG